MDNLTIKDTLDLEDIFKQEFIDRQLPAGGFPELWFRVVVRFLSYRGYVIVKKPTIDTRPN